MNDQTTASAELEARAVRMQREEHWRAWDERNRRIIRDIERRRAYDEAFVQVEHRPFARWWLRFKEALTS